MNTCLMHLRSRRSRAKCALEDHLGDDGTPRFHMSVHDYRVDIEGACLTSERRHIIEQAVSKLPATLRKPLETHLSLDCSLAQIARHHNLSMPAVKSRLLRARLAVKDACLLRDR